MSEKKITPTGKRKLRFVQPAELAIQGRGQRKAKYTDIANELRKRPGKWAVLPFEYANKSTAYNFAHAIRAGKLKAFPEGEYDALARYQPEQEEFLVFARYLGD